MTNIKLFGYPDREAEETFREIVKIFGNIEGEDARGSVVTIVESRVRGLLGNNRPYIEVADTKVLRGTGIVKILEDQLEKKHDIELTGITLFVPADE